VAENAQGALGDIHGLIADAFEVIVDAGNGEHKTEIDGHELVQRKELNDPVVDFQLEFVDGVFFLEDALGELLVGFQDGVDCLVNGAFRKAAHPEQPLLQLIQIFFEMTFHESLPQLPPSPRPEQDFPFRQSIRDAENAHGPE
jgi:hypothetical protein